MIWTVERVFPASWRTEDRFKWKADRTDRKLINKLNYVGMFWVSNTASVKCNLKFYYTD